MNKEKILFGLISLALGVLLIFFKSTVVQIAITALGVYILVLGIIDITKYKKKDLGIIKIIIGAVFILLAWLIAAIAFIVLGVLLVVSGIYQIYKHFTSNTKLVGFKQNFEALVSPIILTVAGICCFFAEATDKMFIVIGIIIAIFGVVDIIFSIKK